MIQVAVVRLAICEICCSRKAFLPGEDIPRTCWECHSEYWMYGQPSLAIIRRRKGRIPKPKVTDGAKKVSLSRWLWSKRQWRQFKDKQGNKIPMP